MNRPMWCDDFDMDLPKVLPDALELLGDTAAVELLTHGHTTHGVLNHPTVWNGDLGLEAYFGFRHTGKPEICWTRDAIVRCTFWEAMRDAWPHGFVMLVGGRPILDAGRLRPAFDAIMWQTRGWQGASEAKAARARTIVTHALVQAAECLRQAMALAT